MQTVHWNNASLSDLPEDVLLEVVTWLALMSRKRKYTPISPKFNVLYVLSQVNHRFRTVTMPFLCRNLHFDDYEAFYRAAKKFESKTYNYAHLVRSIQVGRPPNPCWIYWHVIGSNFVAHCHRTMFPFPNVVSLECIGGLVGPEELRVLAASSAQNLKELILAWHDSYRFDFQKHIPRLETLRLYLFTAAFSPINSPGLSHSTQYTSITRLSLYDMTRLGSTFMSSCIECINFPNLRVFSFQEVLGGGADVIFDFIQCHPTLLEVNVSFRFASLRFESLIKLIHGTGTWRIRGDTRRKKDLDKITEADFKSSDPPPANVLNSWICFKKFAFRRRPLSNEPILCQPSVNLESNDPRYEPTALALYMQDQEFWMVDELEVADILEFLRVAAVFPELEQLRVTTRVLSVDVKFFDEWMLAIGENLRAFPRLRTLALHWPMNRYEEDNWRWSRIDKVYAEPFSFVPSIDTAHPPFDRCMFNLSPKEKQNVSSAVRTALDLSPDEDLDEEDSDLLMRAWAAKNEKFVEQTMRRLAGCCPLLEEIEWYPHASCVRWRWRIIRKEDGSVATLRNELSWWGRLTGDPQPFLIFVGEELERSIRDAQGRWI